MKSKKVVKPRKSPDTDLIAQMLSALKEAESVIRTQNHGNCLVSILDAIARAENKSRKK